MNCNCNNGFMGCGNNSWWIILIIFFLFCGCGNSCGCGCGCGCGTAHSVGLVHIRAAGQMAGAALQGGKLDGPPIKIKIIVNVAKKYSL